MAALAAEMYVLLGCAQVLCEPAAGGADGEPGGQLPALLADAAAAGAGDWQCSVAGEPIRAVVDHDEVAAGLHALRRLGRPNFCIRCQSAHETPRVSEIQAG